MEIGPAIKSLRDSLGLTQEELARRCALARTYVVLVERGHNSANNYRKRAALARGLGIKLEELDAVLEEEMPIAEARRLVVSRNASTTTAA